MSKQIPQRTYDVLRSFNDLSVDVFGYACTLFIPTNLDVVETFDIYAKPSDKTFTEYETSVFIEWSPDVKRLRKLGLYTEDETPMLAWFKNCPEVTRESYFRIPIQYIPRNIDTDEFEIVDIPIKGMGDAVALKGYKFAPRRVC